MSAARCQAQHAPPAASRVLNGERTDAAGAAPGTAATCQQQLDRIRMAVLHSIDEGIGGLRRACRKQQRHHARLAVRSGHTECRLRAACAPSTCVGGRSRILQQRACAIDRTSCTAAACLEECGVAGRPAGRSVGCGRPDRSQTVQ